ncbi:TPA: thermonuclease family protein [Enterobacter hormaechei]|nr:thermonuclease family protein [Enterobacter hormaechei]
MFKTGFYPTSAAVLMVVLTGNAGADIQGRVIRVLDGDTIEVLQVTNERSRIRLDGIDAPEKKQAFGQRSRQFLNNQVGQQVVVVTGDKTDRYGRILGTVWLEDLNVNAMQVGNGMAWAYCYHGKASNSEYLRMEKEARKDKRGLWADPDPVEPWKWRMNYR